MNNPYLIRFSLSAIGGIIWLAAGIFYNYFGKKKILFEDEADNAALIHRKLTFFAFFIAGSIVTYVYGCFENNLSLLLLNLLYIPMIITTICEIKNNSIPVIGIILSALTAVFNWICQAFAGKSDKIFAELVSVAAIAAITFISCIFSVKVFKGKGLTASQSALLIVFSAFAPAVQSIVMICLCLLAIFLVCLLKRLCSGKKYASVFNVPYKFSPIFFGCFLFLAAIGWI